MPELPEVETIVNDLRPMVEGRSIASVSLIWPRMVLQPSAEEFCRRLPGQTIRKITRLGKYLFFRLTSGEILVLHLRMTGVLMFRRTNSASTAPTPYVTAVFTLDDGSELVFCDKRKFGTASLIENVVEIAYKLGPDALDPGITPASLGRKLSKRKAPIKAVLCDQKFVAGIGNMYADEALFSSRIHPLRPANSLSEEETGRLHRAIREVLKMGIANAGATFSDYRRPGGEKGSQQEYFKAAHRGGQTCYVCSTPIERISVRNRGTYFCPRCQGSPTCSGS